MRELGVAVGPIAVGPMREPLWPGGVVGSITHCGSFWAATVARRSHIRGLGVDAAVNRPLEPHVRELIVSSDEEAAWAERSSADAAWDVVLFSAKEAVFKAWWPARRQWLEFTDVAIALDDTTGNFAACISLAAGETQTISGHFTTCRGLVLTTAVMR